MRKSMIVLAALAVSACARPAENQSVAYPVEEVPDEKAEILTLAPLGLQGVLTTAPRIEPVLVDVNSFVAAARSAGQQVEPGAMAAALGGQISDVSTDSAVVRPSEYRFEVRDRGLHVSMDSIAAIEHGYELFMTYRYTEDRASSAGIGMAHIGITFTRAGRTWQKRSERVLATT